MPSARSPSCSSRSSKPNGYWSARTLAAAVADLRALGITIALDDVGTGRCNFAAILDVAPDLLKLDRYLVNGCADDARRAAIVESVQRLSEAIGASVVAEGIETREDFEFVRAAGVRYAQGYFFSRPAPLAELRGRLHERQHKEGEACPEKRFFSSTTPTRFS